GFDRSLEVQQSKDVTKHSNQNSQTDSKPNIVLMFVGDLGCRNPNSKHRISINLQWTV
ncbi:MAG: hypothetical protein ACI87E_000727, partial [Mariniblastus sp.]